MDNTIPEIYLDGEKLSCDNPAEMKTLRDIVTSVSGYCLGQSPASTVISAVIDGKKTDIDSIDMTVQSSSVSRIDFESMALTDIAFNNLDALSEYIEHAGKAANSPDASECTKAADELSSVFGGVMVQTIEMFPSASVCRLFYTLRKDISAAVNILHGVSKGSCRELISHCSDILHNIKDEIQAASKAGVTPSVYSDTLPGTIDAIDDILPKMSEVSQQLTAGHDKDAMAIVADFSGIMENGLGFYSILSQNADNQSDTVNEDFFKDMKGKLEELMQAMVNNDSILIGDLMEYEFVPALEDLKGYLTSMIDAE